ncbi:MAG: ribosomal-processing cysteine protease Prp [Bacillota bacterium]|jgi:uncharacterized protein YsxB (DUF464 family)|nr:ribosomal-processing cysteine protease Prp [Bacillota bacterium]HHU43478.1 ribosomal-processing cysteine protease Prp [Clostridiales bacterium]
MIKVRIVRDDKDNIQTVECIGHSGYAKKGEDIVCSAVSAIVQTALLGLMDLSKEVLFQRKDGYLKFNCPKPKDRQEETRQQAILRAMFIGLKDLQSGYNAFIELEEI